MSNSFFQKGASQDILKKFARHINIHVWRVWQTFFLHSVGGLTKVTLCRNAHLVGTFSTM